MEGRQENLNVLTVRSLCTSLHNILSKTSSPILLRVSEGSSSSSEDFNFGLSSASDQLL